MIPNDYGMTPEFRDAIIPIAAMIPFMEECPTDEESDRFDAAVNEVAERFEVDGEFVVTQALVMLQ